MVWTSEESDGFLVVPAVFKAAVVLRERGEVGSIPSLSVSAFAAQRSAVWARLLLVSVVLGGLGSASAAEAPKQREFLLTYGAAVSGLAPGQSARVWAPVPRRQSGQEVAEISRRVPGRCTVADDPVTGNRMLYFQATVDASGTVTFETQYRIIRREIDSSVPAREIPLENMERYLAPDALVPVGGKTLKLLRGLSLPADQWALARTLYDVVDDHMDYRKDKPGWGRGDAEWACESGYGNCTDFHSLFISLARSQHIPARFEMGLSLPEQRGRGAIAGYHCWAFCKPAGRGWLAVDVSEARKNPARRDYFFGHLDENRVALSAGRDLLLIPRQAGGPLNFFIDPYVEVDGKPYPPEKVARKAAFEDLPLH